MLLDPVTLVKEILTADGYDVEQGDRFDNRALSADGYVFVQELTGLTPHLRYAARPGRQSLGSAVGGDSAARSVAYRVLDSLQAAQGVKYDAGGVHRVITTIRPSVINLPGQPFGVGRCSLQIDLILSTWSHWGGPPS